MPEPITNLLHRASPRRVGRAVVITVLVIVVVVGATAGAAAAYKGIYRNMVYPGVLVGGTDLGGMTAAEVEQFAESLNNHYATTGVPIRFTDKFGEARTIVYKIIAADEAPEAIKLNSKGLAAIALNTGRPNNTLAALLAPLRLRFDPISLTVPVVTDESRLIQTLKAELFAYEDMAHDASLAYNAVTRQPRIVKEVAGQTFDYPTLMAEIAKTLATVSSDPVTAELTLRVPRITEEDITEVLPKLQSVLDYGTISVSFNDPETKRHEEWQFGPDTIARAIVVDRDENGAVVLSLNREKVEAYVEDTVSAAVATEPQEAKFAVGEDGKVTEFQGSRAGIAVDVRETADLIIAAFNTRNYASEAVIRLVPVSVRIVEPSIKTADVNNLGITDVLGVGISTFKNSPNNRIKNIAHAVERLNGLLVKPGETFSANKSAGPFTAENGYLPEAVIKGREIKPEIGGGMCQIGTTLFRMAMNSGMPITQRHNHSLVVGYYADPVNGNPGTDATLYEPSLDFKFLNDTGHYLLVQTEMDRAKGELKFTLWGTADGRSGSYTHPLVSKWIPAGEEETMYVDVGKIKDGDIKVKVGETKCQNAFRGAVASFEYTRFTTSGEKLVQKFDSYYRPLPRICLIGVAPENFCDGKPCDLATSSTPAVTQ